MPIDVIRYEPHTLLALSPFKFFFFNSFIDCIFTAAKLFNKVIWERTKNEASGCVASNGADMKLWIYFMYVVAQCLHFVMPYVKQNKTRTQTLESALYELETIFTWQTLNYNDLNTIAAKTF